MVCVWVEGCGTSDGQDAARGSSLGDVAGELQRNRAPAQSRAAADEGLSALSLPPFSGAWLKVPSMLDGAGEVTLRSCKPALIKISWLSPTRSDDGGNAGTVLGRCPALEKYQCRRN